MTPDETASYIRHHLEQTGRSAELIATAGAGKNLVDHASARAAIAEVTATD